MGLKAAGRRLQVMEMVGADNEIRAFDKRAPRRPQPFTAAHEAGLRMFPLPACMQEGTMLTTVQAGAPADLCTSTIAMHGVDHALDIIACKSRCRSNDQLQHAALLCSLARRKTGIGPKITKAGG